MGKETEISWTDSTFNPWWGCVKISPGCKNCYADAWDRRWGESHWGPDASRRFFGDGHWSEPLAWDRAARDRIYSDFTVEQRQAGEHLKARPRVFCASMADVFEDRPDLVEQRARLFRLIDATPFLDWLLLTKRPENIARLWPDHSEDVLSRDDEGELFQIHIESRTNCDGAEGDCCWGSGWLPKMPCPIPSERYRQNVWLGTTVENQEYANRRLPWLLRAESLCPILFVSHEPSLGEVDFRQIECPYDFDREGARYYDALKGHSYWPDGEYGVAGPSLDWIIVGGESGRDARPIHPDWARSVREQCVAANVPFHFKQWGEFIPRSHTDQRGAWHAEQVPDGWRVAVKGDPAWGTITPSEWYPSTTPFNGHDDDGSGEALLLRVGKKDSGRMLDGRIWDEVPTP